MIGERQIIGSIQRVNKKWLGNIALAVTMPWISIGSLPALAQDLPLGISGPSLPLPSPVVTPAIPFLPPPSSPAPVIPTTQDRVLVTIDPGHGGKDSGAIGVNNLREVDVILPIAQQVASILIQKGIQVQMTRATDVFVGLDERVVMSRQAGATLFVSIHANSIDNRPDVRGLETYYYNLGQSFAQTVHSTIIDYFNIQKRTPIIDRRIRSARFLVLRKSTIPAILVETGYLSSPEESPQLGDPKYQTIMAEGIAKGIIVYLQNSGKKLSSLAPAESIDLKLEPQPNTSN